MGIKGASSWNLSKIVVNIRIAICRRFKEVRLLTRQVFFWVSFICQWVFGTSRTTQLDFLKRFYVIGNTFIDNTVCAKLLGFVVKVGYD